MTRRDDNPDMPQKHCAKCGEDKPATTEFFSVDRSKRDGFRSHCKLCKNTAHAKWKSENRGKTSQWRVENREKIKVQDAKYRTDNLDKVKAKDARYRAENRDKIRASQAKWRTENPEKKKISNARWLASHPEKGRASFQRYKARRRALPSTYTITEWCHCLEYFGHRCAYCGRPRGLWHTLAQDHWIPLSRGGGYTADNIVPACHGEGGCNNSKSNRPAHEWLVDKFGARKAGRIERNIREYFDGVKSGLSATEEVV